MPIIDINHKKSVATQTLIELGENIPDIVSKALACDEEPYDGKLKPGDINIKFAAALPDNTELDYLIEIKTRHFESRKRNLQERTDAIKTELSSRGLEKLGVWVELQDAAWSQD